MRLQALNIALLSVAGLIALLFCFFGSRYFRAVFTLAAFFSGLIAAYCLAGVFFSMLFAKIAIILAGGLVFALIFNQLQFLGRFFTGVFCCFCLGILFAIALNISDSPYFWDVVLALCLILGFLGAVNQPLVLRVSTAVFGAFIAALTVFYIIARGAPDADFQSLKALQQGISAVLSQYIYSIVGATAFLTLAGTFVQFFLTIREPAKNEGLRPAYTALTPPLLEGPESNQASLPGRYVGKHVKMDYKPQKKSGEISIDS